VDRKMAILSSLGHELIVVAPGREDRTEKRPGGGSIRYIKAPRMPLDPNYGLFWDPAPIEALLHQLDPDVIENCSPWRSAWIVGGHRGRALKSFFMHNDNMDAYPKRLLRGIASPGRIERAFAWYDRYMNRVLEPYDTVVTNGPSLFKRLTARGVRVDAAMTLGIERAEFSLAHRDPQLRASLLAHCGLPPEGHLLLGLGRHHPEKRWRMIIDAVEQAGATRPVGLVLIGEGMQTALLERRVADCPHIRLFRPVYDRALLARITASADAFIHGCGNESFGLVVSEALASGTPLIVPDEGGAAEVAGPGFAETYVAGSAASAAAAIIRLCSRDQVALRRAAALAARSVRTDREHVVALLAHYAARLSCDFAKAA
jgi:alpha-1,6-mannosyltransferase